MDLMEKIAKYFASQSNIIGVYLFGSHAIGKANSRSDIDIAVLLDKSDCDSAFDLSLRYSTDLMKALKSDEVDVIVLNDAGTLLKFQVLKYGVPILINDKNKWDKFKLSVQMEYLDFLPAIKIMEEVTRKKASRW